MFVGKLDRGKITGNSDIKSVNLGEVRVQRRPRRRVQRPIYFMGELAQERTEKS